MISCPTHAHQVAYHPKDRRRVPVAGCTPNPNGAWVAQQARQMVWELEERGLPIRFLIHDTDSSFTQAFDTVFRAEGIGVNHTACRAPMRTSMPKGGFAPWVLHRKL